MKYINVFEDNAAYTAAKDNLEKPQLAYVKDGKTVYSLSKGSQPGPTPIGPANNEIWYTTTDNNASIFDIQTNMESEAEGWATVPINVVSNAFDTDKGMYVATFDGPVTAIGEDYDNSNVYPSFFNWRYVNDNIVSVILPNSIQNLYKQPFDKCEKLESISIQAGGRYDSRNNCYAIIETSTNILVLGCRNTVIPDTVTSIGTEAFNYCKGLANITIPNSVTSIGNYAFGYCNGLTSITIPNSVTSIGSHAFEYCSGLTNCTIGNSVMSIPENTFQYCSSLTSITIPNSVTSISSYAFYRCSGLTNCTIGNSVTSIGESAFYDCLLTSITSLNTTPPTLGVNAFNGVPSTCPIYVPSTSVDAYKAASGWSERAQYIQAMPTE